MFFRNLNKDNTLNHIKTLENVSTSEHNEELKIKNHCVITEYNPVEDFNTFLENGFNSDIGAVYFINIITIILTLCNFIILSKVMKCFNISILY